MSVASKKSEASNPVIYIKKDKEHLLSNPVFYNHNPPSVQRESAKPSLHNSTLNVACSDCINKDLHEKKLDQKKRTRLEDSTLVNVNKQNISQKEEREASKKVNKKIWYIEDLSNHMKLHQESKMKERQNQLDEDSKLLNMMKSEVLIEEKRNTREKRERANSQIELKNNLDTQLQQKKVLLQKERQEKLTFKENPKLLPSESRNQSRSSLSRNSYKLDLDAMVTQKQNAKRSESEEGFEKERERLLKVIDKEQQEEKRQERHKVQKKKIEASTMNDNHLLVENRKKQSQLMHEKENSRPLRTFFDEDKRKAKEQEKQNRWKEELKSSMKQQQRSAQSSLKKDEPQKSRAFSSYRSNGVPRSVSSVPSMGVKIVVQDDKVCCTKCHQDKPSRDVGNYIFF